MGLFGWLRSGKRDAPRAPEPPPLQPGEAYRSLFGDPRPTPAPAAPTPVVTAPPPPTVVLAPPTEPSAPPAQPTPPPPPPAVQIEYRPFPDDVLYRTPDELSVTPLPVSRILVIGSCFSETLPVYLGFAFRGATCDHLLYNHAGSLPPRPPQPIDSYDLQIVALALRTVMPEQLYFRLAYDDVAGHEAAFAEARDRLIQMLHGALAFREERQIPTFVFNYLVPQQNAAGRLLPRYDLRNPAYFVEQLNRVIADEIASLPGVHLLDADGISANFGRKYIQDDLIWLTTHQSVASDYDLEFDRARLEVPAPLSSLQEFRAGEFLIAAAHEMHAMYRTIRQADQVKVVIVDLDDTLWRGVVAEEGLARPMLTEGWPVGVAEALAFLKKRGVLLAIVSKNDEARIRDLWRYIYGGRLELADFASVKINWEPKADNIERILAELNLLPRSAVFIDDNPVERANVKSAFPDLRVLDASPYKWRRILLWAAETQVPYITGESARRTEMIQAQVARETARTRMSRPEFLASLDIRVRLFPLRDAADERFARSFELINKSNQFNTTGRRWTQDECIAAFAAGTIFWAFEVEDRFTRYGVVGVAIATGGDIQQFVMSCRVVGLEVELAVVAAVTRAAGGQAIGRLVETDANFLCRDLFARCGFVARDDGWVLPAGSPVGHPAHIPALDVEAVA